MGYLAYKFFSWARGSTGGAINSAVQKTPTDTELASTVQPESSWFGSSYQHSKQAAEASANFMVDVEKFVSNVGVVGMQLASIHNLHTYLAGNLCSFHAYTSILSMLTSNPFAKVAYTAASKGSLVMYNHPAALLLTLTALCFKAFPDPIKNVDQSFGQMIEHGAESLFHTSAAFTDAFIGTTKTTIDVGAQAVEVGTKLASYSAETLASSAKTTANVGAQAGTFLALAASYAKDSLISAAEVVTNAGTQALEILSQAGAIASTDTESSNVAAAESAHTLVEFDIIGDIVVL